MKNIVPNENCLTEAQLLQYLRDECSTDDEKAIDRHLTHCPMCSDALEGVMLLNTARLERSLGHLDTKIDTRFSDKKHVEQQAVIKEEPIMTVVKSPRKWGWLWAAASIALIGGAALWVMTKPMDQNETPPVLANSSNAKQADSILQTTDSSKDVVQAETRQKTDVKQPASTDADVAMANNKVNSPTQSPVTTNIPKNNGDANTSKPTTTNPNYTEGDAVVSKESKTQQENAQNGNDYSGAVTQNNARVPNPARAAKTNQTTDDGLVDYQLAMRFYQKEQYNEAVASLNRVLRKQNTPDVYQNALWYLANGYLKLGKQKEARVLLQRIVNENGKFTQKAAALLN